MKKQNEIDMALIVIAAIIMGTCIGLVAKEIECQKLRAEIVALNTAEVVVEEERVAASVAELETTDCATDFIEYDEYTATGYCACEKCCGKWAATQGDVIKGSHGIPLQEGKTVACNYFPAGTQLEIQGYGVYTVADTGAMNGKVIDFYFEDHNDAKEFGRQTVYVREVK